MYNPEKFRSTDVQEVAHLVDQNPFATLITTTSEGLPFISHLPLVRLRSEDSSLAAANDKLILVGHLSRANDHWRHLPNSPVTVIFRGSHAFISSSWYEKPDVPTWNYTVAHLSGAAQLIESNQEITDCLKALSQRTEELWPSGWNFFIPDDLLGDELQKNIVGFQITVNSFELKKKLSQNRSPFDRANIMTELAKRTEQSSASTLIEMQKIYDETGRLK